MTLTLRAHAKINRDLRIAGRDAEGYHLISTVFETLALHDTITLAAAEGPLRVTCSDPGLPTDGRNLVTRAIVGWCALHRGGDTSGLCVHVEKRIPMQAGLGGGSADAAATLVGLTMLEHGLTSSAAGRDALTEPDWRLAAGLGADVAFFLVGGRALGTGRGERLRPLDEAAARPVVLVQPGFGVATADAYRWFAEAAGLGPGESLGRWADVAKVHPSGCTNDLQAPVAARHPKIDLLVSRLHGLGARQAAMTGSGSVVFGVFDHEPEARAAFLAVGRLAGRSWLTTTLPRAGCWP